MNYNNDKMALRTFLSALIFTYTYVYISKKCLLYHFLEILISHIFYQMYAHVNPDSLPSTSQFPAPTERTAISSWPNLLHHGIGKCTKPICQLLVLGLVPEVPHNVPAVVIVRLRAEATHTTVSFGALKCRKEVMKVECERGLFRIARQPLWLVLRRK